MGFRFRKSIKILPGVRLNAGKKGMSVSVGGKGFTQNFSKKGTKTTISLPGTGISYSENNKNGGCLIPIIIGFSGIVSIIIYIAA